jgi:hypothetical protein
MGCKARIANAFWKLNGTEIESNSIPKESLNGRIENVAELL